MLSRFSPGKITPKSLSLFGCGRFPFRKFFIFPVIVGVSFSLLGPSLGQLVNGFPCGWLFLIFRLSSIPKKKPFVSKRLSSHVWFSILSCDKFKSIFIIQQIIGKKISKIKSKLSF